MSTMLEQAPSSMADAYGEIGREVEYLSFTKLEADYLENRALETGPIRCGRLTFTRDGEEIRDLTGYNAAQPILDELYDPESGKPYFILGVRMEEREDEVDSRIEYFRATSPFSTRWELIEDAELPKIKGQDPTITTIGGQLLLGVVEVETIPNEDKLAPKELRWWTAFYKGQGIRSLEQFAKGPIGMKDITPVELQSRAVMNFTRPQKPGDEERGGLGQIGEVTTDSIDGIKDPNVLQNAALIDTRFEPGKEWGGVKQAVVLEDGMVGVIGHIARYDTEDPDYKDEEQKPKIYSPISAIYNPTTRKFEEVKLLAMADECEGVEPKTKLLRKVAFGTGITLPDENGDVMLILGVGDAESWYKMIKDPFAGRRIGS